MKRVPLQRKTPIRPKGSIKRAAKPGQRKPPKTGFTETVKARVRRRSGNLCEVGAEGCQGKGLHFHHRKLRRFGDHSEHNCLHACQSCHTYIHHNVEISYIRGWLVQSWKDPIEVPVR